MPPSSTSPFRDVAFMGVILVVHEASKRGFTNGHPDWANLGQGQPEVGPMEGAPARISTVEIAPEDHAYGPIEGTPELRAAVAAYYNRLYRQGKRSQYGPEHVAIAQGGRLALSRTLAAVADVTIGYQLPDYTAYEDMLGLHLARLTPYPVRVPAEEGFLLTPERFAAAVRHAGLGAFLVSNPCNPTGRHLGVEALAEIVATARAAGCTLLLDEFYSHFVYAPTGPGGAWGPAPGPVSAAAVVDDVDTDPVVLFDGLTKSHRYPGWRLGWTVGPPDVVETLARAGSALDGGPSRIVQRAALDALADAQADQETRALREVFAVKRNVMVEALEDLGVRFAGPPDSTFYVWGDLSALPPPLDDAEAFFWRALDHQVMTVPGRFFDVNPARRRRGPSPYRSWMRFSFGPPLDNLRMGLDRLGDLVREARSPAGAVVR